MPGTAKTLLVRTLAYALGLSFKRIQFTPDLMPTDVTGTDIIEEDITTGRRTWTFVPGPLFAHVLLADEINRTPPKTQSALLEYRRLGGHDPDALIALAKALAAADRNADALDVLDDVLMVAPLRAEVHSELGDRLLAAGQADRAAVEYRALLAMNPHDLADANYRLAKAYVALEDRTRSREHLLYALEIAPHYREAQQLLLEILR
jgi:tetratricopeptide (TPR) repeat protein